MESVGDFPPAANLLWASTDPGSEGFMRLYDVTLPSRVDATTSGDVRYALQVALDSIHEGDLSVDASAVVSLDVAGLGVLVAAHRRARQCGVRLVLCDPQPRMLRILAVTRLHRVLNLDRVAAEAS